MVKHISSATILYLLLEYEKSKLMELKPKAKCKLDGLSLVVKYSEKKTNLLLSADEKGFAYIIDTMKPILNKNSHNPEIPTIPIDCKQLFGIKILN